MTVTPQSRVQVLDVPIAAPGNCSMCGSVGGDGRKFLDYGKQLDWYGAVYFCSECIKEFASAVDYIAKAAFDGLYKDYQKLEVAYDKLVKRNQVMENALRNVLGKSDSSDDLVASAMAVVEESNSSVEIDRVDDDGDSSTEQSSSVEGLDDFFDSSDFGES